MVTAGSGTFEFTAWDEQTVDEAEGGARITRAEVQNRFSGTIEGTSRLAYVTLYLPDGAASFTGYEQIVGSVDGRTGSFVLIHTGTVANADSPTDFVVTGGWQVAPGSGRGELTGLRGEGGFSGGHDDPGTPYTFAYAFDA